jgi:hypothetical protein
MRRIYSQVLVNRLIPPILMSLLVLAGLGGCGQKTATMTGKVTLDNQPLPNATVTVYGGANQSVVAGDRTREDGSYTIPNAPVGAVKVTVKTTRPASDESSSHPDMKPKDKQVNLPNLPGQRSAANKEVPFVAVPPKYHRIETSGLTTEVKPGDNTFNIPLKSGAARE